MMRTQTHLNLKEKEVIEYNRRQIALMENRINLYRSNQIPLRTFIDDIDALLDLSFKRSLISYAVGETITGSSRSLC